MDDNYAQADHQPQVERPVLHVKFAAVLHWLGEAGHWRLGLVIGVAIALIKMPFVFTALGEDDQGRIIMNAIEYVHHGAETPRQYGAFTSPLWVLTLAGIAATIGNASLVLLTNIGGWLCGAAATTLGFVLLRQFGASRSWAAAGALATGLLPGTFYLSLYGYPSQYAMPLILAAAVAFASSVRTGQSTRTSFAWFGLAAVAYSLLTTTKIDFALSGTLMLSVAIVTGKLLDRRTWMLPLVGAAGAAAVYGLTSIAIDGQNLMGFLGIVDTRHPWRNEVLLDTHAHTTLYACGFGTLFLLAAALLVGLIRGGRRLKVIAATIGWAFAALPIWIFWTAHQPMSSRHAAPGALATALFAALLASFAFRGVRYAPAIWLVALVGISWPFGEPNHDVNYFPSGNLTRTLYVNRKAFAVADAIAHTIAEAPEVNKVVVGPRRWDLFGGIDFVPGTEVAMAARAKEVRLVAPSAQGGWQHLYIAEDGTETRLHAYLPVASAVGIKRAVHYSPWRANVNRLRSVGRVEVLNPEQMFEDTEPAWVYRLLE